MKKSSKWVVIIIILLLIVAGGMGFFAYDKKQAENRTSVATKNHEVSMANVIKTSIELYYALNDEYPRNSEDLLEELEKNNVDTETLQKSLKELKDFNYSIRGDEQAYKFTYTDAEGNIQSVEGNYIKDFHNK